MKNKVKEEDLINWWLKKYHNTNLDKVLKDNPEWSTELQKHSRDFYAKYTVTQEQHDEWLKWAKSYTKKITKIPNSRFEKSWCWVYLNVAPSIKRENNE